jgi:REP element-mobilizing transposase RayT
MALYSSENCLPAHRLHFTWAGWPKDGTAFSPAPPPRLVSEWTTALVPDGIHVLSHHWESGLIQLTCRTEPAVAPIFFTQRVKGRLQHAARQLGQSMEFSRKVGMRAIGENISDVVIAYVREQLDHAELADPRYVESLARQAIDDPVVNLTEPSETHSGRYWYNLHLVMVVAGRYRIGREDCLLRLRAAAQDAAQETGCRIKALAIMPDHVHIAMRGHLDLPPVEIGVAFQNRMSVGCRLWDDRFYVGTFGEYGLRVVLTASRRACPAGG